MVYEQCVKALPGRYQELILVSFGNVYTSHLFVKFSTIPRRLTASRFPNAKVTAGSEARFAAARPEGTNVLLPCCPGPVWACPVPADCKSSLHRNEVCPRSIGASLWHSVQA